MKRSIKNVLMIILILLICISTIATMNYAKNNITISNNDPNMQNGDAPPDNPSGSNPPQSKEMPNSQNQGEPNQKSSNNAKPDKPSDNNSKEQSFQNENIPQDKPDGKKSNAPSSMEMPDNNTFKPSISYVYYIIFAFQSLLLSILIIYLILSKFNKKSFKETFARKQNIIISIITIIILTSGLTYLNGIITNKVFLNTQNNNSDFNPDNMQQMSQNSTSVYYSAVKMITNDDIIKEGSFDSSNADEIALLTDDSNVNISNITVNKTGDSDGGDDTSFYGTNSAILAKGGSNLTLKNINVTTDATGANGVFCYGGSAATNNSSSDGTIVNIRDSIITTTKDNSGGIMTTGGGIMNASNLTVNTSGTSSAAIRSDRGGGTVKVDGGTYTTTGKGSPSIYSTADIRVCNASLTSKASEGIIVEGKNSVSIDNVTLDDTNSKLNGQSTTYKNIFLYQSMSGDASDGIAKFTSKNSNITTNKGDTFYITNTTAQIDLSNNTIINNDSEGNFLKAQKDSWGKDGSNGGNVTLNMTNQKASGNIIADSISTIDMTLYTNSSYEGTINGDNSAKSITLTLDNSSKIKLTGDSYITSLDNADASNSNIDFNGYKLYVNGKAINN